MPSPWLMARASGFYCRVFVPADLRPLVGQRFLVRALGARDRDHARLIAAQVAIAVGDLYRHLRRELTMPEPKVSDVLRALQSGSARELIVREFTRPDGTVGREAVIENARDAKLVKEHFPGLVAPAPAAQPLYAGRYRRREAHATPVSARIGEYEAQLTKQNRTTKYVKESQDAVAILIDMAGDLPPDDYEPDIVDAFMKRLEYLPPNPEKDKKHRTRWATRTHLQRSTEVEYLGLPRISSTTVTKHVSRLSAFFTFCRL